MAHPAARRGHRSYGIGVGGGLPDLTSVLLIGQTTISGWTPRARGDTGRTSDEARWQK